jgi:arylsulfatase A-like enzyme
MDPPNFWDYRDEDRWENFEDFEDFAGVDPATHRAMVALYDAEIRHVDSWVGRFLDGLREAGLYDPALIVLLSDHGEEFDDHGGWFHGLTLYEEMVGMPLVIKLPGGSLAGTRSARSVDMVDLAATVSGLAGIDHGFKGEDHTAQLGVDQAAAPTRAFVERPPHLYGLRRGDWKLIRRMRDGEAEDRLFHLSRDPGELIDVAAAEPDTLRVLQFELEAILSRFGPGSCRGGAEELDREGLRVLRTLGYTN